jgi:hypothetical protein
MTPNLPGELLVNRHRGIMLNVEHRAGDDTGARRAVQ